MLRPEELLRGLVEDAEALAGAGVPAALIGALGSGAASGWSSADLALLDEARALLDGPPEKVYDHLVVDGAQQLTEMEWRMLMRRCPSRSMTIVGDLAQAGHTTTLTTWTEALARFVGERFERHALTVNHRTAAEILEASGHTLALIDPVQRLSRSIRHGDGLTMLSVAVADLEAVLSDLAVRLEEGHPGELIGLSAAPDRAWEDRSGRRARGGEGRPRARSARTRVRHGHPRGPGRDPTRELGRAPGPLRRADAGDEAARHAHDRAGC